MKIFLTIFITSIIVIIIINILNYASFNGEKKSNLKQSSYKKWLKQKNQ
jgi:uncharacterized membrane protein (DUF106 family)